MADLQKMRDLVRLAKTTGDDNVTGYRNEKRSGHVDDYTYHRLLPNKHFIVQLYAQRFLDNNKNKALDIYGDTTSRKYNFIDEKAGDHVYVNSAGRDLLETGWRGFPKGVFYAWIEKHKLLTNLVWIIIGAVMATILNNMVSIVKFIADHIH